MIVANVDSPRAFLAEVARHTAEVPEIPYGWTIVERLVRLTVAGKQISWNPNIYRVWVEASALIGKEHRVWWLLRMNHALASHLETQEEYKAALSVAETIRDKMTHELVSRGLEVRDGYFTVT